MDSQHNQPRYNEKRVCPRVETVNKVGYILLDKHMEKVGHGKGRTLNLSQKGTLLETRNPTFGCFVILVATDLKGKQLQVKGRLVNTRQSDTTGFYLTGVRFSGSREEYINAIVAFIKVYHNRKQLNQNNRLYSTPEKVYVTADNTFIITCPRCKKSKELDGSLLKGHMKVRIKCRCGNVWKNYLIREGS